MNWKRSQPSTGCWETAASPSKPRFSGGKKKYNDNVDEARFGSRTPSSRKSPLSPRPLVHRPPACPPTEHPLATSPPGRPRPGPMPTTQTAAGPPRLSLICLRAVLAPLTWRPHLHVHLHSDLLGLQTLPSLPDTPHLPSKGQLNLQVPPQQPLPQ